MKFTTGDRIKFKDGPSIGGRIVSLGLIGFECIYVGVIWAGSAHISSFDGVFAEHFLGLVERI